MAYWFLPIAVQATTNFIKIFQLQCKLPIMADVESLNIYIAVKAY